MFINLFEEPELEVARLAKSPVSSINHSLSLLPVNITGYVQDLMIQMPRLNEDDQYTIILVPFERYKDNDIDKISVQPIKRHRGYWRCIVVASDNPSYPVGGHRLAVSEAQLVRGAVRSFDIIA